MHEHMPAIYQLSLHRYFDTLLIQDRCSVKLKGDVADSPMCWSRYSLEPLSHALVLCLLCQMLTAGGNEGNFD